MTDRPIIFNAPMVRAILEGRKTQTRRIIKPQPEKIPKEVWQGKYDNGWWWSGAPRIGRMIQMSDMPMFCPFGQPGDRLWVRETWAALPASLHDEKPVNHKTAGLHTWAYEATEIQRQKEYGGKIYNGPWKPSIHMPRHASRITLEITGVRVERLNDLSEFDAIAEGIVGHEDVQPASEYFRELWESIYGPGSWAANPWVWVVEFRKAEN